MRISVKVCDVCEDQVKPTQPYRLTQDTRKATVDLCEDHAKPIENLLPEFKPMPKKAASSNGRRRPSRVATMEDIEAAKK